MRTHRAVLGCPNQQGALPGGPPCAAGICDHCALEKTSGEKAIAGGDGSKWWTNASRALDELTSGPSILA